VLCGILLTPVFRYTYMATSNYYGTGNYYATGDYYTSVKLLYPVMYRLREWRQTGMLYKYK